MKKYAFIPTRDESSKNSQLEDYLQRAGFEVTYLMGEKSIFAAYHKACKPVMADDTVIMCHDDIRILTEPDAFNTFLTMALDEETTGFVGVAGSKILKQSGVWWDGLGKENHFAGMVMHGERLEDMKITPYGAPGGVVVLDGLFLAAKGKTLHSIQLAQPKSFKGNWDFYDIFYTFQAFLKGKTNVVAPIQILHASFGELAGRDSWHANRQEFISMFSDKLPMTILRNRRE